MDEKKKPVGRPQIYQGWQPEQTGRRRPKPAQRPQEERRKGEYRPLAVTEQKVDSQKVLQMPAMQSEPKRPSEIKEQTPEPKQLSEENVQVSEPGQLSEENVQVSEPNQLSGENAQVSEPKQPSGENGQAPESEQPQIHLFEPRKKQVSENQTVRQFEQRQKQVPENQSVRRGEQRQKQAPENQSVRQFEQRQKQAVGPDREQRPGRQSVQRPQQPAEQKKMIAAKRRREQENERKIRALWVVFGFLCVALTAAIFYEIILGHGIKETGAERMEEQKQELVADTEQNNIEILTPGGELVSEIKERENRRSLPKQTETELQSGKESQTEDIGDSMQ